MKTSPNGLALIKAFEGLFLKAYKDPVGILTIGYGHTDAAGAPKVTPGLIVTETQADRILADDLAAVEREVDLFITVPMTQWEFDALVSFHFNTGALRKGTVDDKLNAGKRQAAMDTLLKYVYAGGTQLKGLVRRREAEHQMFEGKIIAALDTAGVKQPPPPPPCPVPVKKKDQQQRPLVIERLRRWLQRLLDRLSRLGPS